MAGSRQQLGAQSRPCPPGWSASAPNKRSTGRAEPAVTATRSPRAPPRSQVSVRGSRGSRPVWCVPRVPVCPMPCAHRAPASTCTPTAPRLPCWLTPTLPLHRAWQSRGLVPATEAVVAALAGPRHRYHPQDHCAWALPLSAAVCLGAPGAPCAHLWLCALPAGPPASPRVPTQTLCPPRVAQTLLSPSTRAAARSCSSRPVWCPVTALAWPPPRTGCSLPPAPVAVPGGGGKPREPLLGATAQPSPGPVLNWRYRVESWGGGCGARGPVREDGSQPCLPAVIHSGDYFLFESDSEEEEETPPEDPRPSAQSAFQVRGGSPACLPPGQPAQICSDSGAPQSDGHTGRRGHGSQAVAPWASVRALLRWPLTTLACEKSCAGLPENGGASCLPLGPYLVLRK